MLAQARRLPQALQARCASGSLQLVQLREGSVLLQDQRAVVLGFGTIASRLPELLARFENEGDRHAPEAEGRRRNSDGHR
jgi:phosphoglycerate dehydrogenase-like enzyme